jgi:hypothetical protein
VGRAAHTVRKGLNLGSFVVALRRLIGMA